MTSQKPKEEEEFLAQRPSWVRKVLQGDFALTRDEQAEMAQTDFPEVIGKAQDVYIELLAKYPKRFREYRKLRKKLGGESALYLLPKLGPGRPRQDSLAQEAAALAQTGLSQSEIARELNRRYPDRSDHKGNPYPVTAESVRKMLARRRGAAPDKT